MNGLGWLPERYCKGWRSENNGTDMDPTPGYVYRELVSNGKFPKIPVGVGWSIWLEGDRVTSEFTRWVRTVSSDEIWSDARKRVR